MFDTSCSLPYRAGIVKGTLSVLVRPATDSFKFIFVGDDTSSHVDSVANFRFIVEQSADTVQLIVNIHKVSAGKQFCSVPSSPLIKGSVKYESADKTCTVKESIEQCPKETGSDVAADGETQVDVVSAFLAGVSKNKDGATKGDVNTSTPFDSQRGNTRHKSIECSVGVNVPGFTS